jgi:hypothetical protein
MNCCRRHYRPDCLEHDCRFDRIDDTLALILHKLTYIELKQETLMANLDKLTDAIAREVTVDNSIITLLNGLAAQLKAANGDQAAIDAVVGQMTSNADAIAAAVSANTPTDPTSSPAPSTPST